jgi:hypothetical protein
VRTLVEDLARAAGGAAHMTALVRTAQGPFRLHQCLPQGDWSFSALCDGIVRRYVTLLHNLPCMTATRAWLRFECAARDRWIRGSVTKFPSSWCQIWGIVTIVTIASGAMIHRNSSMHVGIAVDTTLQLHHLCQHTCSHMNFTRGHLAPSSLL